MINADIFVHIVVFLISKALIKIPFTSLIMPFDFAQDDSSIAHSPFDFAQGDSRHGERSRTIAQGEKLLTTVYFLI